MFVPNLLISVICKPPILVYFIVFHCICPQNQHPDSDGKPAHTDMPTPEEQAFARTDKDSAT